MQNELQTVMNSAAISYTINFTDTIFGTHCGSAVVPTSSSSCGEGTCISTFTIKSASECHPLTDISVTIFGTNALGNGPSSDPTLICKILCYYNHTKIWNIYYFADGINDFVDIDLDFSTTYTAKCRFLKHIRSAAKSCVLHYGPPKQKTQCNSVLPLSSNATATVDTVIVNLQPLNNQYSVYCYRLTASDGIHTAVVVGTFTGIGPGDIESCNEPMFNQAPCYLIYYYRVQSRSTKQWYRCEHPK